MISKLSPVHNRDEGATRQSNVSLPVSGTSVGLAIDLIWSNVCRSGDKPK